MFENADLISVIKKELSDFSDSTLHESGIVVKVLDGIAKVLGLSRSVYGEVVQFDGGNKGVVLQLDENFTSVVLLEKSIPVVENESVVRTGSVMRVGVSEAMIGRTLNALGEPVDDLGSIEAVQWMPVERTPPPITFRESVCEPLETGILVIDSLIPIGKGQRELLLGNRAIGKTSMLIDIILHQKDKNVVCVYVSIGNKQSSTAKTIEVLENNGAMDYTIVIEADSQDSALKQFYAPYTASSIGEFFAEQGRDVFIVFDDLSNHAIAYREIALLLRRPPGREAYPGDIFYIHSRLLERGCNLKKEYGGGSVTMMPVIQTQEDDISAYIPTNLISITDGQIVLDESLFYQGVRPAINIAASVSRVGGAAQIEAMRQVSGTLKLDLSQYKELETFVRFGAELDKVSLNAISRGEKAIEIMKQELFNTLPMTDQVLYLYLLKGHALDSYEKSAAKTFAVKFVSYIKEAEPDLYKQIEAEKSLSQETFERLKLAESNLLLFFVSESSDEAT
jgi:F-type H+-transporting ATPase subunit alpha